MTENEWKQLIRDWKESIDQLLEDFWWPVDMVAYVWRQPVNAEWRIRNDQAR